MVLKTLLRMPYTALRAREESWKYVAASFVQTTSSMLLAVVFLVGLAMGGRGVLLSQLVAELLLAAYLLPAAVGGRRFRFSRVEARDLLAYSAYQIPTAILSLFLHMSDRYFLKHYSTLEAVGLYSLGARFGEIVGFAMAAFGLAWAPFLFENRKHPEAPALYARVSTYYALGLGTVWLVVSLLAEEVIRVMARPAFHEAYRVVPWVAAAFFFQGLAYVGNVGIAINRKVKYRPMILGLATAVNLSLNWYLVPVHGMMGAGMAAFVSFFLWFVLQVAVAQHLYHVPYEYGRLARIAVGVVGLYAVGRLVPWGSVWVAVAGKLLLVLFLPAMLYLSGFFPPGEIGRFRGMLRRRGGRASDALAGAGGGSE
jgi:O-antigen/teichoic acid export membrane protein